MEHDLNITPRTLLTYNNPKIAKGERHGIYTAVMHLAPHKLSGVMNVCAHATDGCAAACLNTAGRGGIGLDENGLNGIQVARIRRTRYFKRDPKGFKTMLAKEIDAHVRRAARHGMQPAVRLNGTSDLPWENIEFLGHENVMAAYPDVQFYDYTKVPVSKRRTDIPNYHLTFSLAESNRADAVAALNAGINVAAVFRTPKGAALPSPYNLGGFRRVIDGDATDARFTDTAGAIIGLRAKGSARYDKTGFVLDTA